MGKEANKSGKRLENSVEALLKDYDYHEVLNDQYFASKEVSEQKIYSKQVPIGQTIYDTKRKCDFITYTPHTKKELVIECKWQDVAGSVDEKYPFLVLNIEKTGIDTIIVLDGKGYKPKAAEWLKKQEQKIDCLLRVMSSTDFARCIKKGFNLGKIHL